MEIFVALIFLVAVAVSKMISSAATRKLDDGMKLKIFASFSSRNNYFMIAIFAVVLRISFQQDISPTIFS